MTLPTMTVEALLAEAGRLYGLITTDEKGQAIAARNNLQRATLLTAMAQVLTDRSSSAIDQTLKSLRDDLTAQQNKTVTLRAGIVTTTVLLGINSTTERPLVWPDGGFKDANYDVQFLPCSGMANSTYSVKAGTKTATGLTVSITATGLSLAAGSVLGVIGLRHAA